MPVTVVDASALAAVTFTEPEGPAIEARLANASLVAPGLIWFEMANVCLTKIRRQPDEEGRLLERFEDALQLAIDIRPVDYLAVVALAKQTGLSIYDASYLWLSRELGAELVTLDTQLIEAEKGAS